MMIVIKLIICLPSRISVPSPNFSCVTSPPFQEFSDLMARQSISSVYQSGLPISESNSVGQIPDFIKIPFFATLSLATDLSSLYHTERINFLLFRSPIPVLIKTPRVCYEFTLPKITLETHINFFSKFTPSQVYFTLRMNH